MKMDQDEQQEAHYEQERARTRDMDDLVSALAAQTTDLGIASADTFKNAASSLVGWGLEGAQYVLEEAHPLYQDPMLRERIVEAIASASSSGRYLRRLAELQLIAAAFANIGAHSRQIASYAVEMGEHADRDLQMGFAPIYPLLFVLVQQAFVEIRGSIVISNERDTAKARRLLEEDSQMDLLYLRLQGIVQQAIDHNPLRAYLFLQALLVGARIKDIGDEVRAICRALLRHATM
jgi:phosphate uptake regulator